MGGGPGSRWVPRLVALSASSVVAAAIVEIAFRVTAVTPWYERLEEQALRTPVVLEDVGGQPFHVREALAHPPKPPGSFRILFLGDSFTYGTGVEDPARVFPSLVVAELNEAGPAGAAARSESFNGGIPGSLTQHWVQRFQRAVGPYQPDLVVAVFFLRDGTRGLGGSTGHIREIGRRMAALSDESWLFRRSRAYRHLRERRAQREFSRDYLRAIRQANVGGPDETAEWRRAQVNLARIRDEAERRGSKFALVIFPLLFSLGRDYPLEDVCQLIERFATEQGFPVLSLLPVFRGRSAPSLWVSPLNQHPNETAHVLAAEAIAEFVAPLIAAGSRPAERRAG